VKVRVFSTAPFWKNRLSLLAQPVFSCPFLPEMEQTAAREETGHLKMFRFLKIAFMALAALSAGFGPSWAAGWKEGQHMPTARAYAGAAVLGDTLYVIGGGGTTGPRSLTETYDLTYKRWGLGAALPAGLQQFGIAVLNGKIYVAGGYKAADAMAGTQEGETAELWVFDPTVGIWVSRSSMPSARSSFGLLASGSKLYAVGGDTGAVFVFDPSKDAWSVAKSALPAPRKGAAYAVMGESLYVIGGVQGSAATARVDIYDTAKDSWRSGSALPSPRQGIAAAVIGSEIHVAGGQIVEPPKTYADHFVLNTKTGGWSKSAAMPTARHAAAAIAVNNDFYVIGGSPGAGVYTVFTQTDVMEVWSK